MSECRKKHSSWKFILAEDIKLSIAKFYKIISYDKDETNFSDSFCSEILTVRNLY